MERFFDYSLVQDRTARSTLSFGSFTNLCEMKHLILLFLSLSIFACDLDDDGCGLSSEYQTPAGYLMARRGQISTNEDFEPHSIYMVDRRVGFAYHRDRGFRATGGGQTWTFQPISFPVERGRFVYADGQNGWVTVPQADSAAVIMRTTNGGATFEEVTYPNIERSFTEIARAANGDLYAIIGGFGDLAGVARSTDEGQTFERIYTGTGGPLEKLSVTENTVAFVDAGPVVITDRAGQVRQRVLGRNLGGDDTYHVVDDDHVYVADWEGLYRTLDGGNTWEDLYDREAVIHGGRVGSEGVLLHLAAEECSHSSGAYDVTMFGALGEAIDLGPKMLSIATYDIRDVQYLGGGRWALVDYRGDYYELVRQ